MGKLRYADDCDVPESHKFKASLARSMDKWWGTNRNQAQENQIHRDIQKWVIDNKVGTVWLRFTSVYIDTTDHNIFGSYYQVNSHYYFDSESSLLLLHMELRQAWED